MVHRWGESGQELKRSKNLEGEAETHAAYWFVPAQPLSYIIPDPGRHNPSGKSFSTSILITKNALQVHLQAKAFSQLTSLSETTITCIKLIKNKNKKTETM